MVGGETEIKSHFALQVSAAFHVYRNRRPVARIPVMLIAFAVVANVIQDVREFFGEWRLVLSLHR